MMPQFTGRDKKAGNLLRRLSRPVQWLVITNLYIALAACCFQLVIVALVGRWDNWNWMLTVHTFASTWMVYQFSRWNFHKNVREHNFKRDEIYAWLDRHPNFTITTAVLSGGVALATLFFLKRETIGILAGLGTVSILYPLNFRVRGRSYGLRSVPFAKIFLIALVWAGISVWVPLREMGFPLTEHWTRFAFHFIFILFITLPFDIADVDTDQQNDLRTLPGWLGIGTAKFMTAGLGLVLIAYESLRLYVNNAMDADYLSVFILLVATLIFYTFTLDQKSDKWKVMAVFDGSMMVFLLITLLCG